MTNKQFQNSPFAFYRYAKECIEAYRAISGANTNPMILFNVKYYLLCNAIELSLKAFLLSNKVTLKILTNKKYGHNLNNLFLKATALGLCEILTISKEEAELLPILSHYYSNKELEYPISRAKTLPTFTTTESFAVKITNTEFKMIRSV